MRYACTFWKHIEKNVVYHYFNFKCEKLKVQVGNNPQVHS